MRVLIADKFEKSGIDGLKALGCEVLFEPDLKDQALADALARTTAEVLIVRSTKVAAPAMAPSLKLIVRAGAGVNTIDVAAATAHNVIVANCPGKNSAAVAELAFGLMLALDRRIPDNVADLRNGTWNKKEYAERARVVRPDAGTPRRRQHRVRDDPPRRWLFDERRHVEPALRWAGSPADGG